MAEKIRLFFKNIFNWALILPILVICFGFFFGITVSPWMSFGLITAVFIWIVASINRYTKSYIILEKYSSLSYFQFGILIAFFIYLLLCLMILDIKQYSGLYLGLSIIGAVLAKIFEDSVKSIIAYIYLHAKGLIHINDWIQINSKGIDGELQSITLLSAVVRNWDTTTTIFPTYLLYTENLVNYQEMYEGFTPGRHLQQTFTINHCGIRKLTAHDAAILTEALCSDTNGPRYLNADMIGEGMLNIEVFRKYVFHYLMANPAVSQMPRLIVRWMESTDEGLELQIYVYLNKTSLALYEQEKARIIEHIIASMDTFDLQLYQRPSAQDFTNHNA